MEPLAACLAVPALCLLASWQPKRRAAGKQNMLSSTFMASWQRFTDAMYVLVLVDACTEFITN